MPDDLTQPMFVLAEGLRRGTCRAQDLFDAAAARHTKFGEGLNAYAVWLEKSACQTAIAADSAFQTGVTSGPLQGIPISLKDSFGVEGVPTHVGSVRRLPAAWEAEGSIVRRLRRQRGVIVGKTHSTEFALSATGANPYGPAPRNPWAREHYVGAGGSSSGAGVCVLEGSAKLAVATDTLGSVRIPASVTGTVGVKTSVGRWPTDEIVPLSPTFDSVGLIARTVADAAFGYAAIDGPEDSAHQCWTDMREINVAGAKIGIDDSMWRHCDASISRVANAAIDELARAGAKLVSVSLPEAAKLLRSFRTAWLRSRSLIPFLRPSCPTGGLYWGLDLLHLPSAAPPPPRVSTCPIESDTTSWPQGGMAAHESRYRSSPPRP